MTTSERNPDHSADKPGWKESFAFYLEPASLRMVSLGFSSGLPLLLVLGTLGFWLRRAGIDRETIGFLSWVGLAYGFKWVWSPLVDRLPVPLLGRRMGRRRSWLLVAQVWIVAGLVGMAFIDPRIALSPMVWCAIAVAFGSATQDIALDAFRIESAEPRYQAALAATYQTGYRVGMIWAGAGVFTLVSLVNAGVDSDAYQYLGWRVAYLVMAASMLPGVLTVLFSGEPASRADSAVDQQEAQRLAGHFAQSGVPWYGVFVIATMALWLAAWAAVNLYALVVQAPQVNPLAAIGVSRYVTWFSGLVPGSPGLLATVAWATLLALYGASIAGIAVSGQRVLLPGVFTPLAVWFTRAFYTPFADFIGRYRWQAALILALIATYRISDVVMGIMAGPFYVDMGYKELEIGAVTKLYGVIMTIVGAFLGGALTVRFGVMRVLMLGAVLSAGSNLLFAWLAGQGHDVGKLIWVISADNLSSGIASCAFVAWLSSLTNINYSATQYALFSSMMLLLPKFVAGFSGVYVNHFGYAAFFNATALLGVPVLLLVWFAARMARGKPG